MKISTFSTFKKEQFPWKLQTEIRYTQSTLWYLWVYLRIWGWSSSSKKEPRILESKSLLVGGKQNDAKVGFFCYVCASCNSALLCLVLFPYYFFLQKSGVDFSQLSLPSQLSEAEYSGYLINAHCAFIYLFPRKFLPCAALIHSSEQYYVSPVRLFIFGKIPCPVRLFHTVRLLDSPEQEQLPLV